MEQYSELITSILSLSICGVSLATVVAFVIKMIVTIRANKKWLQAATEQIDVTKETIETAFTNAVLPKTVKLDVSSKIQAPISEAMTKLQESNDEQLSEIKEQNRLILAVLSQFTHVQKLSEADQEKIADIVNEEATTTVEV